MNSTTHTLSTDHLASLGEELGHIAAALAKVSNKLQNISTLKTRKVSKKSDPEMSTKEFLQTLRKSRKEFAKGEYSDYKSVRHSLGL